MNINHNELSRFSSDTLSITSNIHMNSSNDELENLKDNSKICFTLDLTLSKQDLNQSFESNFEKLEIKTKNEDLNLSDIVLSSSNYNDIERLSDTETYIIENDNDLIEVKRNFSSTFKRSKNRHGTFDINRLLLLLSSNTINRPIIDSNILTNQLEEQHYQIESKNKIKPSEYFIIPSKSEIKHFPNKNKSQCLNENSIINKDSNIKNETYCLSSYKFNQIENKIISDKYLKSKTVSINSNRQINRAVQLRRERAKAKIEELSKCSSKQLNKKNSFNFKLNSQLTTKTFIKSEEKSLKSLSNSNNFNIEKIKNNGETLAIKLIQLSSTIAEKLKLNEIVNYDESKLNELENIVNKLQMIHDTLICINKSLTNSTNK